MILRVNAPTLHHLLNPTTKGLVGLQTLWRFFQLVEPQPLIRTALVNGWSMFHFLSTTPANSSPINTIVSIVLCALLIVPSHS
jgi:hypothetical protein